MVYLRFSSQRLYSINQARASSAGELRKCIDSRKHTSITKRVLLDSVDDVIEMGAKLHSRRVRHIPWDSHPIAQVPEALGERFAFPILIRVWCRGGGLG